MRSTLLRLERQRDHGHGEAPAVDLLQRTYDELAEAVLAAGAERGYLGRDPLGALAQLDAPDPHVVHLGQVALELWHAFFNTFRPDELDFEARRFRDAAHELDRQVAELAPGSAATPEMSLHLLEGLLALWEDRQDAINQRLDALIGELNDHQRKLGSSDLERAYQEDELGQATRLVGEVLRDLGVSISNEDPLSGLLAKLVRTWRDQLQQRSEAADHLRDRHRGLMTALASVATGKDLTAETEHLDGGALGVVKAVADLVSANRELESEQRRTQQRLAQLKAERANIDNELTARDQLIARYEFGEADHGDADDRLELYRMICAAFERGENPQQLLEDVRDLERVFIITSGDHDQAVGLLDRLLDGVAKSLAELRRVLPLSEDPRRYRPRLLAGSKYKFKTLQGMLQASRDASRDVLSYAARARWAAGVRVLQREFKKLRKIFAEMVKLVGDARDQLGGPPPASITLDIGSADGLASLPSALAVDLRALMRTKGGSKVMAEIATLLEECVTLFHQAMTKARGEEISRPEAPRRESASKAIDRLAGELLELAGLMEAVFAEAKQRGWQLAEEEEALLKQDQSLQLAVRDLDGMCDVVLALAGAPTAEFPKVPKGRSKTATSDLDRLLAATRSRVQWLEEVARYRVELSA